MADFNDGRSTDRAGEQGKKPATGAAKAIAPTSAPRPRDLKAHFPEPIVMCDMGEEQ